MRLPESKNPRRQGVFEKVGSFLLSRTKMSSIIGEEALNFRVRNGFGCIHFSVTAIFLAPFGRKYIDEEGKEAKTSLTGY